MLTFFLRKKRKKKGKKEKKCMLTFDILIHVSVVSEPPRSNSISFNFQNHSTFKACMRSERRVRVRVLLCEFGN